MSNDCHGDKKYQLWGGRFELETSDIMKQFNDSLPYDKRLWREDIQVV